MLKDLNCYPVFVRGIIKTSYDMHSNGWTEANGGNISLRLKSEFLEEIKKLQPQKEWIPLNGSVPGLAQDFFLVSGTGRFLRNISLFPEKNVGVIELDEKGENYRICWGFEGDGQPTSEIFAHLLTHEIRKQVSNGREHAVIHTHTPNLIALTYHKNYTTAELTELLWTYHVECVVVFPEGVCMLPWMMAGSFDIGKKTAEAMKNHRMVLWQHHGIFSSGRNLDESFGLIHTSEKSADIFRKVTQMGGTASKPDLDRLKMIAENFNKKLNPDIYNVLKSKTSG